MSSTSSATALPRHIDPRKFAQQGVSVHGYIDLSLMDRIVPLLASNEGQIVAELVFGASDEHQQQCLQGKLNAKVDMVCQRCLEPCPQQLEAEIKLAMLWNDDQVSQLPKTWDPWIVAEGQVDIYQVLEDELILSLPIVAYHDYLCIAPERYQSGDRQTTQQAADKLSPFHVLEQLKGSVKTSPETKD
ncbi:MAG: YceD family protein [Pseudomonadota bacterium]